MNNRNKDIFLHPGIESINKSAKKDISSGNVASSNPTLFAEGINNRAFNNDSKNKGTKSVSTKEPEMK